MCFSIFCCTTYLTNVYPSLILIISPVTDRQAEFVLDVGSIQIHLLVRQRHILISYTSETVFFLRLSRKWFYICLCLSEWNEYIDLENGIMERSNSSLSITVMNISAGGREAIVFPRDKLTE